MSVLSADPRETLGLADPSGCSNLLRRSVMSVTNAGSAWTGNDAEARAGWLSIGRHRPVALVRRWACWSPVLTIFVVFGTYPS